MNRVDILMTPAVNARNFGPAALAVHEIDCLPNAVPPGIISNAERASQRIPSLDHIRARLADFRKIQHLILAQWSCFLLDRFSQSDSPRLLVNHGELIGGQVAGDCGLRGTSCVSAVAESNPSRRYIPALHVIGNHA